MTNILASKYKVSRRVGQSVWGHPKDSFNRRNYRPGQHGKRQRRESSNFGKQGTAQRTFKKYYIMSESQFKRFFKSASKMVGNMNDNLVGVLESRLSAVVYNSRFAPTIYAARQLVSHKHILVNGKCINISSYRVKPGDVVELSDKAKKFQNVAHCISSSDQRVPVYLDVSYEKFTIKLLRLALFSEAPYQTIMNPQLVIEFYSRRV